ncbi:MAG TPA: Mrp/NBP35 family ATP-binding protein [Clostridia bacterium]|nr:Mrp/NBP35 family ATP-binding protein [Clostridia bacterium]
MSECGQNCSGCEKADGCDSKLPDFRADTNEMNDIRKVIAVVSGKGGVGKSLVTSLLAVMTRRKGYEVGILDADITGPSIPKIFGVNGMAKGNEFGIIPAKTHNGIGMMSINLLIEKEEDPVIWRGPIIAGTVKQFWTDVIWGGLDVLYIDMPPGTGDVPLTVFQSIPLDGIIIVTSPQDLVSMIVRKAYNMAERMNIPVLGLIENMSYTICPDCGKKIELFGESKARATAEELGITFLGRLPIDTTVAKLCDSGDIEKFDNDYVNEAVAVVEKLL